MHSFAESLDHSMRHPPIDGNSGGRENERMDNWVSLYPTSTSLGDGTLLSGASVDMINDDVAIPGAWEGVENSLAADREVISYPSLELDSAQSGCVAVPTDGTSNLDVNSGHWFNVPRADQVQGPTLMNNPSSLLYTEFQQTAPASALPLSFNLNSQSQSPGDNIQIPLWPSANAIFSSNLSNEPFQRDGAVSQSSQLGPWTILGGKQASTDISKPSGVIQMRSANPSPLGSSLATYDSPISYQFSNPQTGKQLPRSAPQQDRDAQFTQTLLSNVGSKNASKDGKKKVTRANHYGRAGTLRCAQCRRRKVKCIYGHVLLACEFCRRTQLMEPCIKLPSPRQCLNLSRPLPAPSDQKIDPDEALLLQYPFTEGMPDSYLRSVLRELPSIFGPTFADPVLRHAILGFIGHQLPSETFGEKAEQYHTRGLQSISRRLGDLSLSDSDAFAGHIFMLDAVMRGVRGMQLKEYTNISNRIMGHLSQTPENYPAFVRCRKLCYGVTELITLASIVLAPVQHVPSQVNDDASSEASGSPSTIASSGAIPLQPAMEVFCYRMVRRLLPVMSMSLSRPFITIRPICTLLNRIVNSIKKRLMNESDEDDGMSSFEGYFDIPNPVGAISRRHLSIAMDIQTIELLTNFLSNTRILEGLKTPKSVELGRKLGRCLISWSLLLDEDGIALHKKQRMQYELWLLVAAMTLHPEIDGDLTAWVKEFCEENNVVWRYQLTLFWSCQDSENVSRLLSAAMAVTNFEKPSWARLESSMIIAEKLSEGSSEHTEV